ncbi:MAG: hypothetical protein Q7S50_00020 [bacterium]|nr:hypothetical protein [bacterium]
MSKGNFLERLVKRASPKNESIPDKKSAGGTNENAYALDSPERESVRELYRLNNEEGAEEAAVKEDYRDKNQKAVGSLYRFNRLEEMERQADVSKNKKDSEDNEKKAA